MATPTGYLLTIQENYSLAGKNYNNNPQSIGAPRIEAVAETIIAAQPAVLTTRTSDTVGVLTMGNVSHGVTTGAKIDLYYLDANGNQQFAHNVTAGTVAGQSVPITVPTDSSFPEPVLPAAAAVVNVGIVQSFTVSLIGNNMAAWAAGVDTGPALIVALSSAPAELLVMGLVQNGACAWKPGIFANPFAGVTVASVNMSQGDPNAAHEVRFTGLMTS